MSLIQLNDTIGDILAKMSAGNPGAITVLLEIYKESPKIDPQDFMQGLGPILGLDTHRIYGPDIWILYKDVCGSSILNMLAVLRSIQLGMVAEADVKEQIFEIREGVRNDLNKPEPLDIPQILKDVMERLEEFNRVPKEEVPDVPPSWFMHRGIPACSMWGKTEIECLAWAYVAGMALDGDTWHPLTPERCLELISHDDKARFMVGGELCSVIDKHEHALAWWKDITDVLKDAEGGFKVGGLAWNKRRYEMQQQEASAAAQSQPA